MIIDHKSHYVHLSTNPYSVMAMLKKSCYFEFAHGPGKISGNISCITLQPEIIVTSFKVI